MTDPQQRAFVFPGQGSQSVGMLADIAGEQAAVKAAFDEASHGAGVDLWDLSQNGPEEQLNQTEFTQPALLAASVGLYRAYIENGGKAPAIMSGHSLGEYSALVAAGALSLTDAAALVRTRGQLMQSACPAGSGGMAAVLGAEDDMVRNACKHASTNTEIVVPANFNSPGQIVIGGSKPAVDRAVAWLQEQGIRKVMPLAVSVPSHTPLMADAAQQLRAHFEKATWSMPTTPVVQNVDASVHDSIESIQDALVRQLSMPVLWTHCVQKLASSGVTRVIECGPGKVLSGLIKRIDGNLSATTINTPDAISAAVQGEIA